MQIQFSYNKKRYAADLAKPLVISLPLKSGNANPKCFYAPDPNFEPVRTEHFVGSTAAGGVVNFFNVFVNPHGNGTHTECVGHIAKEPYFLRDCLEKSHFFAKVVSIKPRKQRNGDYLISQKQLEEVLIEGESEALIIRTNPNESKKKTKDYSGTNPPYLHHKAVEYLVACGIEHLLVDLPSIDREEDGGKLLAHKAFWNYPTEARKQAAVTEMVFVENEIPDGFYLLEVQCLDIELDVSPSKICLYALSEC